MLEKKQATKELLKERRNTEVEEWRDTVDAGGEAAQMAAAGSRSSERRRVISFCPKWEFFKKDIGGRSEILWSSQGAAAEKKSSDTCRVGGAQYYVSAPPLAGSIGVENWMQRTRKIWRSSALSRVQ